MANIKPEGIWDCTVRSARAGKVDGKTMVQINVQIDSGAAAGQLCTYEDEVTVQSSKYVVRSLKAIGWRGVDLNTVAADAAAWIAKTGGKSTVEIKHLEIRRGKRAGEIWDKPNSIGRGAARPMEALGGEALDDANKALREALALDGGSDEPSDADAPGGAHYPPTGDARVDDIPF